MASESKARTNKQMTITFTLPISCQICLGKVKQPVLCPNLHVFCNLCLEIWLRRNNQCPACRIDIGPENPIKHIIGGHLEEEDTAKKSSPDFRRARFDLLYQEYEDQLEQMKKENLVLRTENNILIAQLEGVEDKNDNLKRDNDNKAVTMSALAAEDGPSLLVLTKNLQEAQKLYQDIKTDLTQLKLENVKLRDENVQLTRENESLRLEIAQRSPKKFGRYTVATLETKIAEQEKEIRQLQKALECSDSYIEELQRQKDMIGMKNNDKELITAGKARFQMNVVPKEDCALKSDNVILADGPRKVLFGKINCESTDEPVKKTNICSGFTSEKLSNSQHTGQNTVIKSTDLQHTGQIAGKKSLDLRQTSLNNMRNCAKRSDNNNQSTIQRAYFESNNNFVVPSLTESNKTTQNLESIMKPGRRNLTSDHNSREADNDDLQEQPSKKVHFNILEQANETSSFDLDMPSPLSSPINNSNKEIRPSTYSSIQINSSSINDYKNKIRNLPFPGLDENVYNLESENIISQGNSSSMLDVFSDTHTSDTSNKTSKRLGKTKKLKTVAVKTAMQLAQDGSEDNVDDAKEDEFDVSMTPEMTDCLKLMNQAERKINPPESSATLRTGISTLSGLSLNTAPIHHIPHPLTIPQSSHGPASLTQHLPTPTTNHGQVFLSLSNPISRWEQQFYGALKVNPYKFSSAAKPPDFPTSSKWNAINVDPFQTGNNHMACSSLDFNPTKTSNMKGDFKFSDPVVVSIPSSEIPSSKIKYSQLNSALSHDCVNPFNLYLGIPSTSNTNNPYSSLCPQYNFTSSVPSTHKDSSYPPSLLASSEPSFNSELNSSSQIYKQSSDLSSSVLELPSDSSQHATKYVSGQSSSRNTSDLEWPDG